MTNTNTTRIFFFRSLLTCMYFHSKLPSSTPNWAFFVLVGVIVCCALVMSKRVVDITPSHQSIPDPKVWTVIRKGGQTTFDRKKEFRDFCHLLSRICGKTKITVRTVVRIPVLYVDTRTVGTWKETRDCWSFVFNPIQYKDCQSQLLEVASYF